MKENIFYTVLGIIMIILIIFAILLWVGMIIVYIAEDYSKNPNLLFIDIPMTILVHWFGYVVIKNTRV